ncbi:glycosyltransferase family 2 protein [Polaribacter sp.]|jgi:glycosyltransferase involved in cell wall biosynthesis|uniref:glycosyltransferase family 2 protein n=1 Tax=Polaribacter sp. TaxID=1920175 RepID=UPI003EEAFA4B
MFSIIIPLYNKFAYIEKAVKSVLAQTFANFELIIVNDGSTDESVNVVQQFTDLRIRIINQPNLGVSSARNKGVNKANYDYIAFLDADDWWDKNFLEEMNRLKEQVPEAGIYGCNYFHVKNKQNKVSKVGLTEGFKSGYINYFETYSKTFAVPFNCSFVVVKKQVLLEYDGFNHNLKFGEDFDLWVRIALNSKIAYINKPLAYSNQDVDSNNRALGSKLWKPENHFIFNLDYLQAEEKTNPILKKLLDGLRVRALIRYRLAGLYKKETNVTLQTVDFSLQPKYYQRIYQWPIVIIRLYFLYKKLGSQLKQKLIKFQK